MSIKHTHQLRAALVNAPAFEGPTSTSYTSYLIGKKTRNALLSLVDHLELAHRELRIDTAIIGYTHRTLVGTQEVVNDLLDIRQLVRLQDNDTRLSAPTEQEEQQHDTVGAIGPTDL